MFYGQRHDGTVPVDPATVGDAMTVDGPPTEPTIAGPLPAVATAAAPASAPGVRRGPTLPRLALPLAAVLVLTVLLGRSVAVPAVGPGPIDPSPGTPAASVPAVTDPSAVGAPAAVDPGPVLGLSDAPLPLTHEVFGFLPYWQMTSTSVAGLRYELLSTIAIFGIGIKRSGALDTTTRGYAAYTGATATRITAAAHAKGVRVVPTFQLFDSGKLATMTGFLHDRAAQKRFIAAAVALMRTRRADGAVLDFEPLPERLSAPFALFAADFGRAIHAKDPKAQLTVTLHQAATDAQIAAVAGSVDRILVMAYDYHWVGSPAVGAVAPLDGPGGDVRLTLLRFLEGAGRARIILGVPYFGYDWPIAFRGPGAAVHTPVSKNGGAWSIGYAEVVSFLKKHPSVKPQWDPIAASPYFTYHDTVHKTDRQVWYEDVQSLAAKYALAKAAGVAGVGIWALGMDTGRTELWGLLKSRFAKR
jgi:spore germination protein YaaH